VKYRIVWTLLRNNVIPSERLDPENERLVNRAFADPIYERDPPLAKEELCWEQGAIYRRNFGKRRTA
jgi:hypothetical protein